MIRRDRNLTTIGVVGTVVAAVCCATPLVVTTVSGVGLTAWLAKVGNVLIPALILGPGLVGLSLYRMQRRER